jgi:hypothetical protein
LNILALSEIIELAGKEVVKDKYCLGRKNNITPTSTNDMIIMMRIAFFHFDKR